METTEINRLRFPIGEFNKPEVVTSEERIGMIETISAFPGSIIEITAGLSEELEWRYRPDGWAIRQVVHHCADSHMNALIRFKLTLTETSPTIKPYYEDRWAVLPDTLEAPIQDSIYILEGVHARWTILLNRMDDLDFKKIYVHPEYGQEFTLDQALANYNWHCKHHFAHVEQALANRGKWN